MQSQKKTMTSFLNTGEQGHCQIKVHLNITFRVLDHTNQNESKKLI